MSVGFASMQHNSSCCPSFAAVCTSARHGIILDTVILAVSIFVLILAGLLII